MGAGWVSVYKSIFEWEWFGDSKMVHTFLYLLLVANWKKGNWQGYTIERGQAVTGRKSISSATGISEQSVRTCLSRLERSGEITTKSTNRFSVITICNYEKYQSEERATNQQLTNNQPTTNHNRISKEVNKQHTSHYSERFLAFWKEYPNKSGKADAYRYWKKHKCENGAFEGLMSSLEKQKKSEGWTKDNGKWIPMGSTWVNGKRWEDETKTSGDSEWY